MLEIKDGMNFNNFLTELKPRSWYNRRENEGNADWIHRVAVKDSNWLEEAKQRECNRYWRQESLHFCFSVLSFLRENNLSKEQMEEDLNMELDLSSHYDYKMSETEKIKHYMILYNKAED